MTPTKQPPLAQVAQAHGDKDKLVDKVVGLIEGLGARGELDKDELKKKIRSVANAKLLRLAATLSEVQAKFGSRDKLVEACAAAQGRGKDGDYRKKLASWPIPRIWDAYQTAERRRARAEKAAKAA